MADYFLAKRGEYKDANSTIDELAKIFDHKSIHERKGSGMDHLKRQKMLQDLGK